MHVEMLIENLGVDVNKDSIEFSELDGKRITGDVEVSGTFPDYGDTATYATVSVYTDGTLDEGIGIIGWSASKDGARVLFGLLTGQDCLDDVPIELMRRFPDACKVLGEAVCEELLRVYRNREDD
jgi:hypothetical protein